SARPVRGRPVFAAYRKIPGSLARKENAPSVPGPCLGTKESGLLLLLAAPPNSRRHCAAASSSGAPVRLRFRLYLQILCGESAARGRFHSAQIAFANVP